jgi:cobyric acid synthase CobQ
MIQGTGSNVGKSLIAAALCRIFLQDGYRVAPFKSQNMALNAAVTRDGLEMSRAQALQAQACRIEPDARMNPILLKPSSEEGCQVVVLGKVRGTLSADAYLDAKAELFPIVKEAYASLASEHDVIVIEGAGSPAEINLMDREIVNMRVAEMADAPVLLVGDIDCGGVFAALVGTLALLPEAQASRIQGLLINKFRGRRSLLDAGLDAVARRTGRPVLGVIPFVDHLRLPDEDSLAWRARRPETTDGAAVTVVAIDLPRTSNFNDLDPLRIEPDVDVRVVRTGEAMGNPDVVVLPGSKSVASDLATLRACGLADAIAAHAAAGGVVIGLCGGLQMMGRAIKDPHGIESATRDVQGLGLLPVETVLEAEKVVRLVAGRHLPTGCDVWGYEIHHGRSQRLGPSSSLIALDSGGVDGVAEGACWGTYLHGIFDSDAFRRAVIDGWRVRKGLPRLGAIQATYDIEAELNRLADVVRESLDLGAVYQMMGIRRRA